LTNIFLQKKGEKKVGELNCPYLNFEPAVKVLAQRNYLSRRVDEMVRNYFITIPFQIQEAATLVCSGISSRGFVSPVPGNSRNTTNPHSLFS